jgi:hypothetical protein
MGERGGLSRDEWRTLQFAPFWMFAAVVGSYGRFDVLEYEAFSRSLASAASAPGRLNRELMTSVAADLDRVAREFAADPRSIGSGLCEVATILKNIPTEEADMVKHGLLSGIGEAVARARGRFGRVMSEEDEKNLELVAQFLS